MKYGRIDARTKDPLSIHVKDVLLDGESVKTFCLMVDDLRGEVEVQKRLAPGISETELLRGSVEIVLTEFGERIANERRD